MIYWRPLLTIYGQKYVDELLYFM